MTGAEIVKKAQGFKHYKYWYGGKGEIATKALADRLRKENPGVWTENYYNTALKDIDGKTRVCDCSGLVCASYGIGTLGSWAIREKYKVWNGKPVPGLIAWKPGHVAIVKDRNGHVIEMRSQSYDYQDTRYRKEAGLTTLLYDPNVDYTVQEVPEHKKKGWHTDAIGKWYRWREGVGPDTYYHDCIKVINGHAYYFDDEGYISKIAVRYISRVPSNDPGGNIDG